MPLLWNMTKAFIIRRHLVKALPSSLRPNYSIIMDPAAGTVSISLPTFFLDAGSLVGHDVLSPDGDIEFAEELRLGQSRTEFYTGARGGRRGLRKMPGPGLAPMLDSVVADVWKLRGEGPAASWMGLRLIGMELNRDHGAIPVRLTVESDLNCPPTLLSCKWPTFVNLALALGFYPLDQTGRCHDAVDKLRDALRHQTKIATPLNLGYIFGGALLQVSPAPTGNIARLQKDMCGYSLTRMLAWHNVMLVRSGKRLTCVALPSLEAFPLSDILAFSTQGIIRWRRGPSGSRVSSTPQLCESYRLDVHTTYWRPETFQDCLTWTIYSELGWAAFPGSLPTSQTFLIWQDMSLVWLSRRERTALDQQLAELITDADLLRDIKGYLEKCWNTPIFLTPPQGLVDITPLTNPTTFRAKLEEQGGGSYAGALRNSTRLGSRFDPTLFMTRPQLWTYIKSHDVGCTIMARYNPDLGARTRTDDVLVPGSLEELAAHLLIAIAIFKAWPRADWFLHWTDVDDDGRVHYRTYNDDPIGSVLRGESSLEELATMGDMYLA